MFGHGILSGKKTYILGGLAILTAVAGFLTGEQDITTTVNAVWEALVGAGLIALRAGVAKSA